MENKFQLILFFFGILQTDQRFLGQDGMAVFPVDNCPGNMSEVKDASIRLNCSYIAYSLNVYHCLPLADLSQLVEFCYDRTSGLVEEGNCMVLYHFTLNNYPCENFAKGCPNRVFFPKMMFKYPACTQINKDKRCFLADPRCAEPVDGGWSPFSFFWTPCTATCGGGIQSGQEVRTCTNPRPSGNGIDCKGSSFGSKSSRSCNTQPCPVDGNWSAFGKYSEWNLCSVTCGTGIQSRSKTRECDNPTPQYGGENCIGTSTLTETKTCVMSPCPVDGHWSEFLPFGDWSQCTVSCGNGTQTRVLFRTCSQPAPLYGGNPCEGPSARKESKPCTRPFCPVPGGWSLFGPFNEWTQCTTSCGAGHQERTRNRTCNNPVPRHGGRDCVGLSFFKEERTCNIKSCPVHGDWSEWGDCSVTCGGGIQQSVRTKACNNTEIQSGEKRCMASKEEKMERKCNTQICPVHGQWSLFFPHGDWSRCSSSCNNGTKTRVRIRYCSEPAPLYGGKPCVGQSMSEESKACNTQPCSEKGNQTPTTTIIIALMSSSLILLGGLLIFFYRQYKRTSRTESLPQPQPEIYEEINSMDIMNNIYVPSYAEYMLNPQLLNRPNPGSALPSLFMNIPRFGSTLTPINNDCQLSEIIGLRKNDEINEIIVQDQSKLAICSRNAFEKKNDDQDEYFDVANTITMESPVDGYEKPMLKSRNSYITVLPDESKELEETAMKDQEDYLDCCHDIEKSGKKLRSSGTCNFDRKMKEDEL